MKIIKPAEITLKPFAVFNKDWKLLSSGDFVSGKWNCMTISWGFLGTMWNLPVVQVVVRPQRYTRRFMDEYGTFTLCSFSEKYRPVLAALGRKSGTEMDKVNKSGLTPVASVHIPAPSFKEASAVMECKILFRERMLPESMLDPRAKAAYPGHDEHYAYIAEVLEIRAD